MTARQVREGHLAVHCAVTEQARRTPAAPAVADAGTIVSYRELDTRSNRLAHHLRGLGVGPEARVAVHLERCADLIVALLAVHKAGGAFVPLDPAYPAARRRYMVADSGAIAIVGRERELAELGAEATARVCLDRDAARIARQPAAALPVTARPDHLAYLLYTSGSTGRPKGVLVQQRSLWNLVSHVARAYDIGPGDRGAMVSAVSFDVTFWEFWPQLVTGGCAVPIDEATRLDPAAVVRWLGANEITVAFLPPALYELVIVQPEVGSLPLRVLMSGGDVARRRPPAGLRFFVENIYGPTETTVVATTATVLDAQHERGTIPIGRPVANTTARVLDERLRPVPDGTLGELCIGGLGVGRGYHNLPALTAERFLPDPYGAPGARLYRTGDQARVRPDGQLEFAGRLDRQVKIRGFRVEPGEVEHVLLDHPAVGLAAVDVRTDGDDPLLAGYVVVRPDWKPPAGNAAQRQPLRAAGNAALGRELRAYLAQRLPGYLVPSVFLVLDELPFTPSGKVDRLRLSGLELAGTAAERFTPPRTRTEELITTMAAEVLNRSRIGVLDDLAAHGAHSLRLTQLGNRMAETFGVELPLRTLFDTPNVAAIAALVEDAVIQQVRAEFKARSAPGGGTGTDDR